MPYYDAEGNEVEGLLTQEELDAKLEEERTTLQSQFEEKQNEAQQKIGELEAAQKAAQAAVDKAESGGGDAGGGGDKEENLAALRTKLEETNAALEAERNANRERFERETSERVSNAILDAVGNDEDMAEKVRHHFTTTLSAVKAETPEEIKAKVANAVKLSADLESGPNPLDMARAGSGYAPRPASSGGEKKFTPQQVEAGKYFGITDADRAKYGNDPRLKK